MNETLSVLEELVRLARHPDSCPQSVPGAQAMERVYPCSCAIGRARDMLSAEKVPAGYSLVVRS